MGPFLLFGAKRPPNTNKETGQDPRGGTDVRLWFSYGHPLRNWRHPQDSATYAPEGMGPRSGVHDGKGARRGTLMKSLCCGRGRHLLEVARRDDLSGLLVAVLDNQPTDIFYGDLFSPAKN